MTIMRRWINLMSASSKLNSKLAKANAAREQFDAPKTLWQRSVQLELCRHKTTQSKNCISCISQNLVPPM